MVAIICMFGVTDVDDDESSGNDFDYASGDSNIIQPLM